MNLYHLHYRLAAMGLGLTLLTALGCSDGRPQRVPVSGRVLIDGKPLEVGFIQVLPTGNRPASGELGPGGRFTLTTFEKDDGCVPGTHSVAVMGYKSLNETKTQWFAPKKYTESKTSGLSLEVTGARDDLELHLTWQGSGHDKPYVENN